MINQLLSISSVFQYIFYIGIALLILLLMITIHELGHYTMGKIFKFKINEFSIGFGKAIYSKKKKNGEIFSVRMVPLGGYCSFAGEDAEVVKEGDFNSKKPWQRLIVLLGGVLFNFLSAIIFSVLLLTCFGYDIPQVKNVNGDNNSQLQKGDIIYSIDGVKIDFCRGNTLNELAINYVDNVVPIIVIRDNEYVDTYLNFATKEIDGQKQYDLEIELGTYRHSLGEAMARGLDLTIAFAGKIFEFFGNLFSGDVDIKGMTGPVGTITTLADYGMQNLGNLFVFIPFIAVNLAIFNFLPLPALDGSRMIFTIIEWIRRKPINRKIEGYIHAVGFMILFAFVILLDLLHFM